MTSLFALLLVLLGSVSTTESEEAIKALGNLAREKQDTEAVDLLKSFPRLYVALEEERDREDLVKAVLKTLSRPRKEETPRLYVAAFSTMARLGEEGAKATVHGLKHRNVKKRPEVLVAGIESLAQHLDEDHVDVLVEYLAHKDANVVAKTAAALGNYVQLKEKKRKSLVKHLVSHYSEYYDRRRVVPHGRFYGRVRSSFESALSRLTRARVSGADSWRTWHNKNKNKRWD